MLTCQIIYFISAILCAANSARILGVFQIPSYSHYQLSDVLLKQLAARGHQVSVISPYQEKQNIKNFRTILLADAQENFKDIKVDLFKLANGNMILDLFTLDDRFLPVTENTLNHTNVQNLMKSNEKFDVVIIERLLNDALHGFCAHFEARCVILSPLPVSSAVNNKMGNSGPPSYVPEPSARYSNQMNFFERAYNALAYLLSTIWFQIHILPTHNSLMHKYFPNVPHLSDIYYNISLLLINSHVSTNPVVPLLPNMIPIGGYHIQPPKELPKDLKEYLDNATEGVIYFNMGSNLESQYLEDAKREAILKSFAGLKQKVLWKWEKERLPNQPPNVKLLKWAPQNDLLAHPNVKLFITHGGLLSSLEAIYHGVPIIGIPVFGDQFSNMKHAEDNGYGIAVPYAELNQQKFGDALKEVLNNPKYLKTAQLKSKIMDDCEMKPLDKAIFWIEYIVRHNGASHLKSPALSLTWYQYLLLDVIACFAFLLIMPISVCYCVCKRKKFPKNKTVKKDKKKQ